MSGPARRRVTADVSAIASLEVRTQVSRPIDAPPHQAPSVTPQT